GVEAADDEHVLRAVGDAQVPALVHHRDVAGVEPAVVVDAGRGLGRVVEVAAHHVVPTDHDLTRLPTGHLDAGVVDDEHLDVGDRASARGGNRLGVVVEAAHRGDA